MGSAVQNSITLAATVSVIIPIKEYEELLERLEDSDDIAWLNKPLHYRPLEDHLSERSQK